MKHAIRSKHQTITEALEASGMDLSYNPQEAKAKARSLDARSSMGKVTEAFVMESGEVWYCNQCDILLLNKFDPFYSVMDDSSFHPVKINGTEIEIFGDIKLPRDMAARKTIARCELMVTTLR